MKQFNSSGKNTTILVAGGVVALLSPLIANALSKLYLHASTNIHASKMKITTSSLALTDTAPILDAQSEKEADQDIEAQKNPVITVSRIEINDGSGMFNSFMKTLFRQKAVFKSVLQQHAELLESSSIIITDPKNDQQLDELINNSITIYNVDGSKEITQSLGRVISLLANPEHSEESIATFLKNIYSTGTASQVSQMLMQAGKLGIFSAFVKAFEKVNAESFSKVVKEALVQKGDDALNGDKLTLFTKFMLGVDVDSHKLDCICAILEFTDAAQITEFANYSSQQNLQDLVSAIMDSAPTKDHVKTHTDERENNTDESQIFQLSIDSPVHYSIRTGGKSQELSMLTGERTEAEASKFTAQSMIQKMLTSMLTHNKGEEEDELSDNESTAESLEAKLGGASPDISDSEV